jgi:hypothetical protein
MILEVANHSVSPNEVTELERRGGRARKGFSI